MKLKAMTAAFVGMLLVTSSQTPVRADNSERRSRATANPELHAPDQLRKITSSLQNESGSVM